MKYSVMIVMLVVEILSILIMIILIAFSSLGIATIYFNRIAIHLLLYSWLAILIVMLLGSGLRVTYICMWENLNFN